MQSLLERAYRVVYSCARYTGQYSSIGTAAKLPSKVSAQLFIMVPYFRKLPGLNVQHMSCTCSTFILPCLCLPLVFNYEGKIFHFIVIELLDTTILADGGVTGRDDG